MRLPVPDGLSSSELQAVVKFHPEDNRQNYPSFYSYNSSTSSPFSMILKFANFLAPCPPVNDSQARLKNGQLVPYSNWEESWDGYRRWAVPENISAGIMSIMRQMNTQFLYGDLATLKGDNTDPAFKYKPEEQLERMFAAPIEREFKKYAETETFSKFGDKVYLLHIEMAPINTSTLDDNQSKMRDKNAPKVWRIVTCHGDMNLDGLHDQIIAPAMGWRRHYHAYNFIIPTNGATFGPAKSNAIDMMHFQRYSFDSEAYEVRHVLREAGQRLVYIYDLGDTWIHNIQVVGIFDKGQQINIETFEKFKHVYEHLKSRKGDDTVTSWIMARPQLIAGEINGPPEDSNGCDGMSNYGSVLKQGQRYKCRGNFGVNWEEHGIHYAYRFDLKAHQKRFNDAIGGKKNRQEGNLVFNHAIHPRAMDFNDPNNPMLHTRIKKKSSKDKVMHDIFTGETEFVNKKSTSSKCAFCGKVKGSNSGVKQLLACGRCKQVSYCGEECQKAHWKAGHKKECKAK